MKRVMLIALIALNLVLSGTAVGEVSDVSVSLRAVEEAATGTDYVRVDAMTVSAPAGKSVSLAQLAFQAQVSSGQFVELWVDDGGEGLPWNRSPVDRSLRKGTWVADQRTGSLVRFDITSLVRAAAGERQMPGLYIRLVADDGDARSLSPTSTPQARIQLHLQRE